MQILERMRSHIVKVQPGDTLEEAADRMDLYQVTSLPVVEADGRLIGILTEHDLALALMQEGLWPSSESDESEDHVSKRPTQSVGDCMTQPAISIEETADLCEAAALMLDRHLKRLPVVTREGQVVGMLSRVDVCQAILEGNL